jgi:hypothetical protein
MSSSDLQRLLSSSTAAFGMDALDMHVCQQVTRNSGRRKSRPIVLEICKRTGCSDVRDGLSFVFGNTKGRRPLRDVLRRLFDRGVEMRLQLEYFQSPWKTSGLPLARSNQSHGAAERQDGPRPCCTPKGFGPVFPMLRKGGLDLQRNRSLIVEYEAVSRSRRR